MLLGGGDGLLMYPDRVRLVRIHAPWNSLDDYQRVVNFFKKGSKFLGTWRGRLENL